LLELAFVVPEANESHLAVELRAARAAVSRIGLGLQVLDDVTDFAEDVEGRNHNMLRSWLVHRGPDGRVTDADLSAVDASVLSTPQRVFPSATGEVLSLAVKLAVDGFEQLHRLGHPIDRAVALALVGALFNLRGLGYLWDFYESFTARDGARDMVTLVLEEAAVHSEPRAS
jgi:hypothetical protein